MRFRTLLHQMLQAAFKAADPLRLIRADVRREGRCLRVGTERYDLDRHARVWVVGAGKAAGRMARAVERILGRDLSGGLVVVPYGYRERTERIRIAEGGHPLPDHNGFRATQAILALLDRTHRTDLVVVLLSGGGSALLTAPPVGIALRDKRRLALRLIRSGASIDEINTVRKHLSDIKGGRMLQKTPATVLGLILSDVVDDRLDTIASGPTAADPTDYRSAIDVLQRYNVWRETAPSIRRHLLWGRRGHLPETVKPGDRRLRKVCNHLLGNNRTVLEAARKACARAAVPAWVLTGSLSGEAREVAKVFGAIAKEIVTHRRPMSPPVCLLAGGETTVSVRGRGVGGRCQEFALAGALAIDGLPGVGLAAISTDGIDGIQPPGGKPAAGAYSDGKTIRKAKRLGIDAQSFLAENDAYRFFHRVGGAIRTGPTRTHLNDLYFLVIEVRKKDRHLSIDAPSP